MRNIFSIAILMLFAFASAMSMQDMRVAYYTTNTNGQSVQLRVVDYSGGGGGQVLFTGETFNGLTPNANGIVVAELKDNLQQQQGTQWSAINANILNTSVTVDIYVDGTLYAQYRLDQLVLDQAQVGVFDNDGNFPPPLVTSTLGTDDDRWQDLYVSGSSVHIGPNEGLANNDELSFSYDDGTNTATFTSANNDFMTVVNDDVTFADQITVDGIGFGQGSGDIVSNISIGVDALVSNTNGSATTAVGYQSLQANTTGGANTALGTNTLQNNISGGFNTATGADALRFNTSGSNNTANGIDALRANTTASNNTAFGYRSLRANTTGTSNTSVGSDALLLNTTGIRNTALGALTLADNTSGGYNIAIGFESATNNTTGDANVALGDAALHKNTTGDFNTALGSHALHEVTASGNVGIGRYAGNFIGSGTNNILIGNEAGNGNNQKADAVGSIAIGYQAYTLGDNSIAIGQGVNTTADNQVVIGNANITETQLNGLVQNDVTNTTNNAELAAATTTVINHSGATAIATGNLPAATDGTIIYLLNASGGNLDVLGNTIADDDVVTLIRIGGTWYASN